MKKKMALLAAAVMGMSLLAGCSGGETAEQTTASEAAAAGDTAAAEGETQAQSADGEEKIVLN